ncbi:MAG: ArsA family ATPase [Candidatus Hodarchaeales archaeon]|jgi:arsenite-transporting ATPase
MVLLSKQFVFFGGKGGVGKTSFAASLAIFAADQGIDTLVLSTDPAHSLSDAFDQEIGSEEIPIRGVANLYAMEIDSDKAASEYKTLIQSQGTEDIFNQLLGGDEGGLAGMTPPGTDESVAFAKVLEFMESPNHQLMIFDTAPTGHTLRLLSLPEVMDSWLYRIITLPKKIGSAFGGLKSLFGGGKKDKNSPQDMLNQLRSRVKIAQKLLADPNQTEFVSVTIPTLMAIWETDRLITALREYHIPSRHLLINQINPENPECSFCTKRHFEQSKIISEIFDLYSEEFTIQEIFLMADELRGVDKLRKLGESLFSKKK